MADAWHGPTVTDKTLDFGPLALIAPLLRHLDIAAIIDRSLPPDPQLAFSHGRILSLLLAARLCQPTALINIPSWAQRTGADLLWDIPAHSLNDDRLGRQSPGRFLHPTTFDPGLRRCPDHPPGRPLPRPPALRPHPPLLPRSLPVLPT